MKIHLTFLMICVVILSCKDDIDSLAPIAKFDVSSFGDDGVNIAVYDSYSLINHSNDATSYLWDFGDGRTSNYREPGLTYTKSGVYTLTLTATNSSGMKSTSTRQVKVHDFRVRRVSIKNLDLNVWARGEWGFPLQDPFPIFTTVKLWVEIKKGEHGLSYPRSDGDVDAPVIYKSPVMSEIAADSPAPISFYVPEKIILDIPALTHSHGYQGVGYAFHLYVQDDTGIYLVSSNQWSGTGTIFSGAVKTNNFTLVSHGLGGGEVEVQGTYELP